MKIKLATKVVQTVFCYFCNVPIRTVFLGDWRTDKPRSRSCHSIQKLLNENGLNLLQNMGIDRNICSVRKPILSETWKYSLFWGIV